ncbi:18501_t:CDS:2, partial [Gigaspora rosea]
NLFALLLCGLVLSYIFYSWNEFILSNNKPNVIITENLENIAFPVTNPNDPYSDIQYNVIQKISCVKQFNNQDYSSCNNHFQLSNGCWTFTPYTVIKDFNNPCGEGLKDCIDITSFSDKNSYFTYKQDYHDLIILNISLFGPPQLNSTSSGYIKMIFNQLFITSEGQFNISDISNIYSISLGQLTIAEFLLKVHHKYSSKFNAQLGFLPTQKEAVLDIDLKLLPLGSNNNYTLLGVCARHACVGAKRYISRAGIPLVDDPRKLPSSAALEDRITILETLLKEYYLDTSYLDIIKETRDRYRYIELNNIYQTLEPINNNANESEMLIQ